MSNSKQPRFVRASLDARSELFGVASVEMIPKFLIERFGRPSPGDGNKVSGLFLFTDEHGAVFSIYDWKLTGSYNPTCSPEELWDLEEIIALNIGSNSRSRETLKRFLRWLDRALADGLEADQDWLARLPAQSLSAENQLRLLQLMENGGTSTQIAALDAVHRIGEPIATLTVLEQLLQLMHLGQPIRPAAIKAISGFASLADSDWVQSYMTEQLNSESAKVRCNGLVALTALGNSVWTSGVLTRFAELLAEEPTAERALACMGSIVVRLGRTTPPPTPQIVSGVAKQLSNSNASMRRHAADATVSLGGAAGVLEILTPLFRMLGEADRYARVSAEMAFKALGRVTALPGLIAHLCQSVRAEDFQVKASALRVARDIVNATGDPEAGRRLARVIKGC